MATNRRCPAVFAGLVCGTLLVAPKVANAAIFQGSDAPLNPRYLVPGLISFGFGLFVGSLLGRQKDRSNKIVTQEPLTLDDTNIFEQKSEAFVSYAGDETDSYKTDEDVASVDSAEESQSSSFAFTSSVEDESQAPKVEEDEDKLTSEYWDHYMPRHASRAQWDMYFQDLGDEDEQVQDSNDKDISAAQVTQKAASNVEDEAADTSRAEKLKSMVPEVKVVVKPEPVMAEAITPEPATLEAATPEPVVAEPVTLEAATLEAATPEPVVAEPTTPAFAQASLDKESLQPSQSCLSEKSAEDMSGAQMAQEAVRDMAHVLDARLPHVYEEPKQSSADLTQAIPGHKPNRYEDIAEVYVDKKQEQKREQVTKKGVGYVLGQRLGFIRKSKMEGIPVIQRADGTVGDVGTSWWDTTVSQDNMRRSPEGFTDYLKVDSDWTADNAMSLEHTREYRATAASAFVQTKPQEPVSAAECRHHTDQAVASEVASTSQDSRNRAQTINLMVPHIETEIFPARGAGGKDLDLWFEALDAMDEGVYEATDEASQRFDDIVGDDNTLDEPEGLESKTAFMPFRVPAGHPEVKDMDSYIEYLLKQEFSQNTSKAVRRNAREYLKVIEGGTADVDKAKVAKALEDQVVLDDIKEA